jgi:hypothetical protein
MELEALVLDLPGPTVAGMTCSNCSISSTRGSRNWTGR